MLGKGLNIGVVVVVVGCRLVAVLYSTFFRNLVYFLATQSGVHHLGHPRDIVYDLRDHIIQRVTREEITQTYNQRFRKFESLIHSSD